MTRPGFAGFGSPPTPSTSTAALQAIDSSTKTFVNKDFVKNIAWLNNSVDTLSQWSQKLQAGVEQANQNIFEQVEGIFADLFVMFAGLEPTGIHVGDLKYVIQGIGALLGINPDTPFPLNLAEAAWNMFSNYIIPAHQFSDVIFDAIDAWAIDLGLSEDFINSIGALRNSFENLWDALDTNMDGLFDALSRLLSAFLPSLNSLGELWNSLVNLFDGIPTTPLHNIFVRLIDLGIPFIDALTAIVNAGTAFLTPFSFISGSQIGTLGENFAPPVSEKTTVWSVGSNSTNAWVFDAGESPFGSVGSFTTLGTGVPKVVRTQEIYPANPGGKFTVQAQLRWLGIPSGANDFGIQLQWYADENMQDVTNLDIPAGHGAAGGWVRSINVSDIVVPQNVNGVRVAARVGPGISTGQVWVSAISIQAQGLIAMGLIDGLLEQLSQFLTNLSPLNAANLVGQISADLLNRLPIGSLTPETPNLLPVKGFPEGSIAENPWWTVDPESSRSPDGTGSAMIEANGTSQALRSGKDSSDRIPVNPGTRFTGRIFVSHDGYIGSGQPAVFLQVVPYVGETPSLPVTLDSYTPTEPNLPWPGHELSGTYQIPENVTSVQLRILLSASVTGGTFRFDDPSATQFRNLRKEWVEGLPEELQDIVARWQLLVDTAFNALTGTTSIFSTLEDLAQALQNIPFANVIGTGGPSNIGGSINEFLNQLVGGLVGKPGENASFADVFNISKLVSSWASRGADAWDILGIRNNKPVDNGLLPSGTSNFNLAAINTTLEATEAQSLIAVKRIEESSPLGVISWLGYGTTGLTAFYINLWLIDPENGNWSLKWHSPNIIGDLTPGSTPTWQFCIIEEPPAVVAGEDYAFEFVPVGGSHFIRGISTEDDIPDHPFAQVVNLAATRDNTGIADNPPSSIAKSSITRSPNVPWVEAAIDTGHDTNYHAPVMLYLTEDESVPVPNWANYIDVIPLGAGGGANIGGTVGFWGRPGEPGKFNATTWRRNEHFSGPTNYVTFSKGLGGKGGDNIFDGAGEKGGDTTFSIGEHQIVGEGGNGGNGLGIGSKPIGLGPGVFEYKEEEFAGGGNQNNYGGDGTVPGGAGNGGNWISFQWGGRGGDGAGWIRFRQYPLDNEDDTGDITPPTPPTVSFESATYSTITVSVSGATDD